MVTRLDDPDAVDVVKRFAAGNGELLLEEILGQVDFGNQRVDLERGVDLEKEPMAVNDDEFDVTEPDVTDPADELFRVVGTCASLNSGVTLTDGDS